VHCTAGKYRSPQIIALYLILKNGLQPTEAIKMIKERHPFANPNEHIIETAVYYIHNEERRLNAYKHK
jgi:protein-tyrosine phosphatase